METLKSLWEKQSHRIQKIKNRVPIGIFILCSLYSFNSFSRGKSFIEFGKEVLRFIKGENLKKQNPDHLPSNSTAKDIENRAKQRQRKGQIDNIQRASSNAVNHSAEVIDKQFNQTLDEILEKKTVTKENLSEAMLDELRAATMDPLKLFDPENSSRFSNSLGFNYKGLHDFVYGSIPLPGQITETTLIYMDIYRAFFQKRLDPDNVLNVHRIETFIHLFPKRAESSKQMHRLKEFIDKYAKELDIDIYEVIRFFSKHKNIEESVYENWIKKLVESLFKDDIFKTTAENCFREGFDRETFFTLWEDKVFRKFIINSKFMKRSHLTGNVELLVKWHMEQVSSYRDADQLITLVKSSFKEASLTRDAEQLLLNDPFWQTVLKAANENSGFRDSLEIKLREIIPIH